MKKIFGILTLASACFAQDATESEPSIEEIKTPEEIQSELDQAQKDFEAAKDLFIPWYTGPLITGSANNAPKGKFNVQGYLFLNDQYADYDDNRKFVDIPEIFTTQPLLVLQYGWTDFIDSTLIVDGFFRWQRHEYAQGFGDLTFGLGFQLIKQTPHIPSIRFTITEVFPTGRYQKFKPDESSIASTGGGLFATQFGLFFNKIFWQIKDHPVSVRLAGIYVLPNHQVHVKGFNSYGGGFETSGKISVGHGLQADLGIEVSLTQKWVFAFDVAYDFAFKTTFKGSSGFTPDWLPAGVGGPSNDQLSIAPAIEYNPHPTGGFIGGVWFSLTGRNSAAFVSGVISYTQLF